jgi:16S rRNA (guanine527-N7)-methyltransferase
MDWKQLAQQYTLTEHQLGQLQRYYTLLCDANELFNITAITDLPSVLAYHFADSLQLMQAIDVEKLSMVADVGTGGGFPGMVLKIKYPHLKMVLIEVAQKKVQFLQDVAAELGLTDIIYYSQDWRTFLRKTDYPVDLVCARASLQPEELIRMFQPSSPYKEASLIYWASEQWEPGPQVAPLVARVFPYRVEDRARKLVELKKETA